MAKIRIISHKPAKLYIDGKEVGAIKKETKEYEVAEGTHEVHAKSGWCGSPVVKVDLDENKDVTLTLSSFPYEDAIRVVMFLFIILFMFTKSIIFLILAGLVILYPLYYITLGCNNYLELKSDQNQNKKAEL
ncbi:MAG: hypothetical protein CR968_04930 [Flavobacteriia bacterium]|nr:MAG: hypothetical protein CR968_04930 [Flavobacteriia bacterium]